MLKLSKYNYYINQHNSHYVANTLTGSLVELEVLECEALQNNLLHSLPIYTIDQLKNAGILIHDSLDEVALLRQTYQRCKFDKTLSRITICPTMDCNFSCPYCYQMRQSGKMSQDIQDGIIAFIEALINDGVKKIALCWYGGEPLLCFDIIEVLTKRIRTICASYDVELTVSMITNGYLLNKVMVDKLVHLGFTQLQITLDGGEEEHNSRRKLHNGNGTYNKIVNNIKICDNAHIFTKVRVNIDRSNTTAFAKVKSLFIDNQNVYCYPTPVTIEKTQNDIQRQLCYSQNEYEEFYKRFKDDLEIEKYENATGTGIYTCSAEHMFSYIIAPDGFVYKCLNDLGNTDYAIKTIFGNVDNAELATAKYFGRDSFTENECRECIMLPSCYGGCVWAYRDKGKHACPSTKFQFHDIVLNKIKEG